MEQPKYIEKNQQVAEAMNFEFLRMEGIRKIQELTGAYWTDYNLHDPGVTILEQLCYAITDLAYRTGTNIEEHLFSGDSSQLPFFRPEVTLTNSPVTIDDYRKIFIDSIPEIRNIWFEPVKQFECGFNGLYRILVNVSDLGIEKENNQEKIEKQIKELFSEYRNLGEDIYEIKVLEELPVKLIADVETDGIHELEQILAKIYFEVEQILAPEVKFYSLNELKNKDKSYNDIFHGPRLKHGFILEDELISQQSSIIISDLVRSIMQIEGVVSVKQLSIEVNGQSFNSQMAIPEGKIPRIITSELITGNSVITNKVKFYRGSLEYTGINLRNFKRFLNELVSENKKSFRISESSFDLPSKSEGMEFSEYYSVQNHFPAIYGVGEEGIPGKHDRKRVAQAKQLKAYLLIFEQFMANYLGQLAHFKDLLSIHKKQEQTYFTQSLKNVPNVDELLVKEKGKISDSYLDLGHIPKDYYQGLEMLNKLFDNYTDRRNRFLDFLLALHGETFSQYALQQFNFYFTDKEFEEYLIRCKTALLQVLGELNYTRFNGVDYLNGKEGYSLSGLEKRLAIFLGFGISEGEDAKISVKNNAGYLKELGQTKIKLVGTKGFTKFKNQWNKEGDVQEYKIENFDIQNKFDFIDDADLEDVDIEKEQQAKILSELLPHRTKTIYKSFLASGIQLSNFKLGKVTKPENLHLLVYNFGEQNNWVVIGKFKKKEEAMVAIKALINWLKEVNIGSESVRMIEHILLRPSPEMPMYGIYINDETGQHILKSDKQFSLKERASILKKIEKHFENSEAFTVEADENRDMNIIFRIEELDLTFRSIKAKVSVEETHKQKELLYEFLSGKNFKTDFAEKIGFYIQYGEGKADIPEEFYSFQISLLFSGWSARFQNEEFRTVAQDIILEQKPANIFANVEWLDPEEMDEFDKLFAKWKEAVNKKDMLEIKDYEEIARLAEFLYTRMDV